MKLDRRFRGPHEILPPHENVFCAAHTTRVAVSATRAPFVARSTARNARIKGLPRCAFGQTTNSFAPPRRTRRAAAHARGASRGLSRTPRGATDACVPGGRFGSCGRSRANAPRAREPPNPHARRLTSTPSFGYDPRDSGEDDDARARVTSTTPAR